MDWNKLLKALIVLLLVESRFWRWKDKIYNNLAASNKTKEEKALQTNKWTELTNLSSSEEDNSLVEPLIIIHLQLVSQILQRIIRAIYTLQKVNFHWLNI